MHVRRLLALAALILSPVPVRAADAPRYTVETLADGMHAVIYNSDLDVEGDTLIVVNDEDVFVLDSNAGVSSAKRTIDELRKISHAPDGSLVVEVPAERLHVARRGRLELAPHGTP